MELTSEQRKEIVLEMKEIMKKLATINLSMSPQNKDWIKDANDNIKNLCELLSY